MTNWHIITCEYPPQVGGVSDYTRLLALHLREAGDPVQVWAPTIDAPKEHGLHRVMGQFDAKYLREVEGLFDAFPQPRTFLLQWVPHGYGKRGMNLGFVHWIVSRVCRGDRLYLMIHEPYLERGKGSWKLRLMSLAQRRMMRLLLQSATRVFVSIPGWETYLRPYLGPNQIYEWLPIPATIAAEKHQQGIAAARNRFSAKLLMGHLGTYSAESRAMLQPAIIETLKQISDVHVMLLGKHSDHFASELKSQVPESSDRIHGLGLLPDVDLTNYISACDLMVQPFIDGVSSRRTSIMNVISRGVPVISNLGHLSESLWGESQAVALASNPDPIQIATVCTRLLRDQQARQQFAERGLALYRSRFEWAHILATLRSSSDGAHVSDSRTSSNQFAAPAKLK